MPTTAEKILPYTLSCKWIKILTRFSIILTTNLPAISIQAVMVGWMSTIRATNKADIRGELSWRGEFAVAAAVLAFSFKYNAILLLPSIYRIFAPEKLPDCIGTLSRGSESALRDLATLQATCLAHYSESVLLSSWDACRFFLFLPYISFVLRVTFFNKFGMPFSLVFHILRNQKHPAAWNFIANSIGCEHRLPLSYKPRNSHWGLWQHWGFGLIVHLGRC